MRPEIQISKALPTQFKAPFEKVVEKLEKWPHLRPMINLRRWGKDGYTLSYLGNISGGYFAFNGQIESDNGHIIFCLARKIQEDIDTLKVKACLQCGDPKYIIENGYPAWAWKIPDALNKAYAQKYPPKIEDVIAEMLNNYRSRIKAEESYKDPQTGQKIRLKWSESALPLNMRKITISNTLPIPRVEFTLADPQWKIYNGIGTNTIHLHGQKLPESLMTSAIGQPLGRYVDHPLLEPNNVIIKIRKTKARVMIDYEPMRCFMAPAPIQAPEEISEIIGRA